MTNKRVGRKLVLCSALLLISVARTAAAECCQWAVVACDNLCQPHNGQASCAEAFYDYACTCNDATVEHTEDKSMCAPI